MDGTAKFFLQHSIADQKLEIAKIQSAIAKTKINIEEMDRWDAEDIRQGQEDGMDYYREYDNLEEQLKHGEKDLRKARRKLTAMRKKLKELLAN